MFNGTDMHPIWINTDTKQPMDEGAIRAAHPLTVFPWPFAPPDGYDSVIDDEAPDHDPVTEQLVCGEPAQVDGQWRRSITVQPLPPEVVADNLERARLARVPQMVSRAQGKVALIQAGLWAQVLAFVAAIPDPVERAVAEVTLHDTQEWRRDSAFLAQAAQALDLTEQQLDELFVTAAEVTL